MQGGASKTAMLVAAYRARASAAENPVCNDPWAGALAGEDGFSFAQSLDTLQPQMELWIAVRTAFIDRHLRHQLGPRCGIRQVVILGAGLDTRAARIATPGVRFFEVDHPDTQAEKRRLTAALPEFPTDAASYASCDFESQEFLARLIDAGFDATRPAAFVWEGVACYLTEEAVRATLRRIATGCAPRSTVIFDTVGRKLVGGTSSYAEDREVAGMVADVGEPVRWGTDDPLPLLFEEGFRKVSATTFDQATLDFTGTYERARRWRFQNMVIASVADPELPGLVP